MSEPRRERIAILADSGRVEAFSDGVLAIAITLLVLDLRIPEHEPGRLLHELTRLWPTYLAYLGSFCYIGVVWVNHHALFTKITGVTNGLLWRNLALLLAVSVLPFPTATVADAIRTGSHSDQLVAIALYGSIAALMAATWWTIFDYLADRPELLRDDLPERFFHDEKRRAVLGMATPPLAVLIGILAPGLALASFTFMAIFYAVTSQGWSRRAAS